MRLGLPLRSFARVSMAQHLRLPSSVELHRESVHVRFDPDAGRGFSNRDFDMSVDRALRVQQADPSAGGALWASINRKVVDEALYVWLVNPVAVDFVSARVGNYQYSPTWDVLLSQLWVRQILAECPVDAAIRAGSCSSMPFG